MLVTNEEFDAAMVNITLHDRISIDCETSGLDVFGGDVLVGISVALDPEYTYYFSFRHKDTNNLSESQLKDLVAELFRHPWTTWNGAFDLKMLRKEYFRLFKADIFPPGVEDLMLASHLLDENQPNFKLKDTGDRLGKYIGLSQAASAEQHKLDDYMLDRALGHGDMWQVSGEIVAPYAEQDVRLTELLRKLFIPALERWELKGLWDEINEYLVVVVQMEERGLLLDNDKIMENSGHCETESLRCLSWIRQISGVEGLNPNSANKFKEYLNARLMVNYGTSITGTDVNILEDLLNVVKAADPLSQIIDLAIDYRRYVKANSAYYKAFVEKSRRGVLHPNLHMAGTVTGRFSSSSPNLQAIPRKEKDDQPKNHVKEVFIARKGYWLVQCDYKQAEIYLGAHFAKSETMATMLREGIDVHAATAQLMGGIDRSIAKRLNFAVQYGIGAKSFAEDVKQQAGLVITEQQAMQYINRYRDTHPEMAALYHTCEQEATEKGFIRLITGRVRRYNGSEYFGKAGTKPSPYHKASSNLVQGSVAEVMRLASTEIHRQLGNKVHQLLHVHDSIICEVPQGREDLLREIKSIMEITHVNEVELLVPMRVDIEYGTRWSELQPWKEQIRDRAL